ncbi:sel1 repeat family protein [Chelativorans composti]|jgi:FOG: TPR repeat, SEL1 subfamily|uniref:Sel1 repeat family protein n=1 Tax=Chelativorans composti TaxID=768533 RepID=A0ABW5DIV6_9HYPH
MNHASNKVFETAGAHNASAEALFRLGLMYAEGRDCEQDLVEAHKWLNIAAIRGSVQAARVRAELVSRMSKLELARALREARTWMTMH